MRFQWFFGTKDTNHISITGPTEDLPRKFECMEFVCHAPVDYFTLRTPIPSTVTDVSAQKTGFIFTRMWSQKPVFSKLDQQEKDVPEMLRQEDDVLDKGTIDTGKEFSSSDVSCSEG